MKKIIIVLLILICSVAMATAQADRQLTVHLSSPGKSFTLIVNCSRAAISVMGYKGKDILIETDALEVTAPEKHNEVTVIAPDRKAVKLNIKVPMTAGIFKLSSVNGGRIVVSDVTGNLEIQNKSGGISALNISGSVIAGTLSGRVIVSFKKVTPATPMAFSTVSGPVDLTFPADIKANLKIKSDNSKVFSDFELEAAQKDGAYYSAAKDWIYGRSGGGGPEFLIKNTTGDIHIYRTK